MFTRYSIRLATGLVGGLCISLLLRATMHGQEGFSTISTVHIDVQYQRGVSDEDAKKVADFLQNEYHGLDIYHDAIRWCQQAITPLYPNFHFHHADVSNTVYNRRGTASARNFHGAGRKSMQGSICTA